MRTIDNVIKKIKFDIGEIVYLKTDNEQLERMVCQMTLTQNSVIYDLVCGSEMSNHFDFEISKERNILKSIQ